MTSYHLCSKLAKNKETPWANKLNSQARQAHADRAWAAISRFYENCRLGKPGKKRYPRYKKFSRSVEYKNTGWKLSPDRKQIIFTDGFKAGKFELWTSRDLVWYSEKQISRVRVVKRADGYYAQFIIDWDRREQHEFQGGIVGIDLGVKEFYTDSNGATVENPRYLRKSEARLKKLQRRVSKRHIKGDAVAMCLSPSKEACPTLGKKQSNRYHKARQALAKQHLKISRQRKDKAIKDALALVRSKDLIVYEDLKIQNMVLAKRGAFSAQNHHLAKSISDASWYQFTQWLQYFAKIHGTIAIAVPPHHTTVDCSNCGAKVHKTLSARTHQCPKCKIVLDRDHNAAKNILAKGLKLLAEYLNGTVGHTGTDSKRVNAQGQFDLWLADRDVSFLSRLDELRISNCAENPPVP